MADINKIVPQLQGAARVYRNNLKNREFDKEAAQIFRSGASDHPGAPKDASSAM